MKSPEFRMVGDASEEEKAETKEALESRLFNQRGSLADAELNVLRAYERERTETELGCIDFANKETDRLMEEAGVEHYDIPAENYHIITRGGFSRLSSANRAAAAITEYKFQRILINEEAFMSRPVIFAATALHETLHLKAHYAIKASGEFYYDYRRGVDIISKKKGRKELEVYFSWLHEAIVQTQVMKSLPRLLEIPALKKEKEWLESDEAKNLKKIRAETNKISESEILWFNSDTKKIIKHPYFYQRKVLDYVCQEIKNEFPDKYQNTEEVFKEFLKANFTGEILTIARLVEKTFGKGGFRFLGSMTQYQEDEPIKESMPKFISILKIRREEARNKN